MDTENDFSDIEKIKNDEIKSSVTAFMKKMMLSSPRRFQNMNVSTTVIDAPPVDQVEINDDVKPIHNIPFSSKKRIEDDDDEEEDEEGDDSDVVQIQSKSVPTSRSLNTNIGIESKEISQNEILKIDSINQPKDNATERKKTLIVQPKGDFSLIFFIIRFDNLSYRFR